MRTGLPAALLRGTPSAIRDDRFTRCPFPAATTHAPVALARSSNTAMEHRNRCTDLRHPELLATSLLKCPRQDCCETPSETKKIGKLSPLSSFIFLTLRLYRRVTGNFFAVSGFHDKNIWYNRCNFAGPFIHCVLLNYPANEKRQWDYVVTKISNTL